MDAQKLLSRKLKGDQPKAKRITPMLAKAVDLIADGTAKTISEAAEMVGCHRTYLSKSLARAHVRQYMLERANLDILTGAPAAARVLVRMVHEAKSETVKADCAQAVLALNGIQPTRAPAAIVNVGVSVNAAGYVLYDDNDPVAGKLDEILGNGPGYLLDLRPSSKPLPPPAVPTDPEKDRLPDHPDFSLRSDQLRVC